MRWLLAGALPDPGDGCIRRPHELLSRAFQFDQNLQQSAVQSTAPTRAFPAGLFYLHGRDWHGAMNVDGCELPIVLCEMPGGPGELHPNGRHVTPHAGKRLPIVSYPQTPGICASEPGAAMRPTTRQAWRTELCREDPNL
eukprot:scaffold84_cov388-Prasinococcus_capsulatus_cf.AAC.15